MSEKQASVSDATYDADNVQGSPNNHWHAMQTRRISENSNLVAKQSNNDSNIDPKTIEDFERGDLDLWDNSFSGSSNYYAVKSVDPREGSNHLDFNVVPGNDQNGASVSDPAPLYSYMKHDQHTRIGEEMVLDFRPKFNVIDEEENLGSGVGFITKLPLSPDTDGMFPDPDEDEFIFHTVKVYAEEVDRYPAENYRFRLIVESENGNSGEDTTGNIALPIDEQPDNPFLGVIEKSARYRKLFINYKDSEIVATIREDGIDLAQVTVSHDGKIEAGGMGIDADVENEGNGGQTNLDFFLDGMQLEIDTGT